MKTLTNDLSTAGSVRFPNGVTFLQNLTSKEVSVWLDKLATVASLKTLSHLSNKILDVHQLGTDLSNLARYLIIWNSIQVLKLFIRNPKMVQIQKWEK